MPNLKQKIDGHNSTILRNFQEKNANKNEKTCNCRSKNSCPLEGNCLAKAIIYRATVQNTSENKENSYIGLVGDTFKSRYANHIKSINNSKYKHETCLSNFTWNLKENDQNFNINWKIIDRGTLFNPSTMRCNLCLKEKYNLLFRTDLCDINTKNEFGATCRHIRRKLISQFNPKGIT